MAKSLCLTAAAVAVSVCALAAAPAYAQSQAPAACPPAPVEVVRSRGGVIDNLGSVPNIPDLCRITRSGDTGTYYYGIWRSDWPGAGDAYPAIKAIMLAGVNAHASFITRSFPGMQWIDTMVNEGVEIKEVDGRSYTTLRIMHERNGIDGNTYHSRITTWRDVMTGVALQTFEQQISGQSYGPDTTWQAVKVLPIAPRAAPAM